MKTSIPNRVTGLNSFLTTERSESSYGIPVLLTDNGVFGPSDRLFPENDELSFLYGDVVTAADLVEKVIISQERFDEESQESYDEKIEAAKLFLSSVNA